MEERQEDERRHKERDGGALNHAPQSENLFSRPLLKLVMHMYLATMLLLLLRSFRSDRNKIRSSVVWTLVVGRKGGNVLWE